MKIKNIFLISISGIAMFICSSCAKQANPFNYTKKQLAFGSGGGFTNQVTEYRLLENKRLFVRKNNDSTFTLLGKQNSRTVRKLFKTSEIVFRDTTGLNEPGNRYYFLRLQTTTRTQSIVWGKPQAGVTENTRELYKHLMNLVSLN